MKRRIATVLLAAGLVLLALAISNRLLEQKENSGQAASPRVQETSPTPEDQQGFLFGRVSTHGGAVYEGCLRWGENEEAFWDDTFNGYKKENSWAALVEAGQLPRERRPITVFGFEIGTRDRPANLGRPFMARFGDIVRIEARGRHVRVTLKSGTAVDLDRMEASDLDDGVRVWDRKRGMVDVDSALVSEIEFLATSGLGAVPKRLQGTVHTRNGSFAGFIQWNRQACVGSDELAGLSNGREIRLPFEDILVIEPHSREGALITLRDGQKLVLTGTGDVGQGNRGISVSSQRSGRVLICWETFERVDFGIGPSGPAYGDFPPGRPFTGSVTTRSGGRMAGRLVYDLDESETTDTLDAPSGGVDYSIPFDLIAAIEPKYPGTNGTRGATVTLRDGTQLQLEPKGDLGDGHAGLLVFPGGRSHPEYVPWNAIVRVDIDSPEMVTTGDGNIRPGGCFQTRSVRRSPTPERSGSRREGPRLRDLFPNRHSFCDSQPSMKLRLPRITPSER